MPPPNSQIRVRNRVRVLLPLRGEQDLDKDLEKRKTTGIRRGAPDLVRRDVRCRDRRRTQ